MCPFLVIRVKDITVAHSGLSPRKSPPVRNILPVFFAQSPFLPIFAPQNDKNTV
jgi:hypothetical protein